VTPQPKTTRRGGGRSRNRANDTPDFQSFIAKKSFSNSITYSSKHWVPTKVATTPILYFDGDLSAEIEIQLRS
jgi:hypothetical protein